MQKMQLFNPNASLDSTMPIDTYSQLVAYFKNLDKKISSPLEHTSDFFLYTPQILFDEPEPKSIEPRDEQHPDLQRIFNNALIETMQTVNKNSKNGAGVWYYDDYAKYCKQNNITLNKTLKDGFANNEFWDMSGHYKFKIKAGKKPSEAIMAFLNGFTIADCGNMIVAAQLAALLKVLGSEKFDAIFNHSIEPLVISQIICDKNNIAAFFFDFGDKKNIPTKGLLGNRPVAEGEMCHIGGVSFYANKHPAGFAGGFNVVCTGKNQNGEDLFLGFGPTTFTDRPLTERELLIQLISAYNLDRDDVDAEHISAIDNPIMFDLEKMHIKDKLTMEEGLEKVIGYMPGSVIKPLYAQINKYLQMDNAKIENYFRLDYANSLIAKATELLPDKSIKKLPMFHLFKREPISYFASKDIEKLSKNSFGWTRNNKRYIYEDGKMFKYVPDDLCEVKIVDMTPEEIAEFKQALVDQSAQLTAAKTLI